MPRACWRLAVTRLHRWLGLSAALAFIPVALTGGVLVFWPEWEDRSYPAPAIADAPSLPMSAIVARALALHPGFGPSVIELPTRRGAAVRATFEVPPRPGAPPALTVVHLDPSTGAVLSERVWGEAWIHWLYDIHNGWIAGQPGMTLVGAIGLVMLAQLGAGLVLWWPRQGQRMVVLPSRRSGRRRRWLDLHRATGLWSAGLLSIAATSGASLAFPETARRLIGGTIGVAPAPPGGMVEAAPFVALDRVLAAASARHPALTVRSVRPPGPDNRDWIVELSAAGALPAPTTQVEIDSTAAVVADISPRAGDTVLAWLRPLHNGSAFGLGYRGLLATVGFVPAILGITGIRVWRAKRRARLARPGLAP